MQEAAKIVAMMLDGRQDIADCMANWPGAGLAIFPKEGVVTDLPEFASLKGKKDMWGQAYDTLEIVGLGGVKSNPVSSTAEQTLVLDPDYPELFYDVVVHEFAHLLMNLCFTHDDHETVEDLRLDPEVVKLGLGEGIMVNSDEFFAGLSEIYFSVDRSFPKRILEYFPQRAQEFLEDFYGPLTAVSAEDPAFYRYVSSSGIATIWAHPSGGAYEHPSLGYSIDLLPGWMPTEHQGRYTKLSSLYGEIGIEYFDLSPEDTLSDMVASRLDSWNSWTRDWNRSVVKSSELEAVDGRESHWIYYNGHESTQYCEIDIIERLMIVQRDESRHGVKVRGSMCRDGDGILGYMSFKDIESMLRSFVP